MTSYRFETVPVDEIVLDEENPRIRPVLEMYDEVTPERISLALGEGMGSEKTSGTTYDRLKTSILVNKGVIQPILVKKQTDSDGFNCIEGNTRVSIYKQFQKDPKIDGDWQQIPALVFDENMTKEEIDAVRLQLHLVGTREWTPYAKAKYLYFLYAEDQMSVEKIVDYCGGNKKDIMDDILAYTNMEKHYRSYTEKIKESFDPTRFSGFRESVKPPIQDAIAESGHSMDDFAEWIHPPSSGMDRAKLHPLNTVRSLPRILSDPTAKKIFLSEGAKRAIIHLETQQGGTSSNIKLSDADIIQLAEALRLALLKMTYEQREKIKKDEYSLDTLRDIGDVIVDEFV
ncbi:hypothetical protein [Candidatus Mycalebacterium sp.]